MSENQISGKSAGDPYQPLSIEASNQDQVLEVQWADGHRSVYPLFGLRKNCPCVACRGGHSEMGKYDMGFFFMDPPRRYEITKLEPIGKHALRITWDDGHNAGMYQWELLRAFCPQSFQKNGE